ncbi:MAG TPA: YXWGXW repeat-containing protein [Kofleriaceae bacterium]|nr:YXWGXW repeat-containing protein [Kofleriaceae bacterium]
MKATTMWLVAGAMMASGCVIREVREIHHVRDPGSGDRAESSGADCDRCDAGAAPGAVMAESQPPPPLVEEALDQPADGYVWTDGYWHWNGFEWVWMSGGWQPPMDGLVFVPPAYYASGAHCLYVPGRWSRPERVRGVRDNRTQRTARDDRLRPGQGVRDNRTRGGGKDDPKRAGVRDNRGKQGTPDVDREVGGRVEPDVVIRVPPRRTRVRPTRSMPDRSSGDGAVEVGGTLDGVREVDRGDGDGGAAGGDRDMVVAPPRGDVRPAQPSVDAPAGAHDRGYVIQPPMRGTMVAPPPRSPAAHTPRGWSRPIQPPVRSAPPPPGGMAPPPRSEPPPRPGHAPVRVGQPARDAVRSAPSAPSAPPAANSGGNRARPAPARTHAPAGRGNARPGRR